MPKLFMNTSLLPTAKYQIEVLAEHSGFITKMEADDIGVAAMLLGAGRATKEDEIDLSVGIVLKKKIGDAVKEGEPIAIIHSNTKDVEQSASILQKHIFIEEKAVKPPRLIGEIITD